MVEEYSGCRPDLSLIDIMKRTENTYSDKHIHHLIEGNIEIKDTSIPILSREISLKDSIGAIGTRLGINRMNYDFPPGLYLIGSYAPSLPVIVTCNYKLTLDILRKSLKGPGYWLLVLDTRGVNVWCAAGKGAFGTEELIYQLVKWDLVGLIGADKIILPQLGASRMTPHIVKSLTGIRVFYGPVDIRDLDEYIDNNYVATENHRTVKFTLKDRLAVSPIETVNSIKYLLPVFAMLYLLYPILNNFVFSLVGAFKLTLPWIIIMLGGTIIFPTLLPLLPFKAFSLNGILVSLPMVLGIINYREWFSLGNDPYQLLAWSIGYMLYAAYLALNFTGSTTYTSFSAVDYEVRLFKKCGKLFGIVASALMILSFLGV